MLLINLLVDFVAASIDRLLDLFPEGVRKVILAVTLFIGLGSLGPFCIFFLMPLILYWLLWGGKPETDED
ncbi:MAG: hypothetical protein J6J31_00440 [Thermoguttaceae bacterium]|nr:hypothetical protein [Thermoguttaceae bacterium]